MTSRGRPGPDNQDAVMILTTDSDYYRYSKDATGPGPAR